MKFKKKLRNNEYYDLQETFDSLYQESTDNKIFTNLMPIISSNNNFIDPPSCLSTN